LRGAEVGEYLLLKREAYWGETLGSGGGDGTFKVQRSDSQLEEL